MGPVLRAPRLDLLDQVTATVDRAGEAGRIVDAGTLAIEAVRRWPRVAVVGIDVPGSMLSTASTAASGLAPEESARLTWIQASADRLPFEDASMDGVVSAFVFQFLPDQPAALREFGRVLRPGGMLAWVTWRAGSPGPFAPDDVSLSSSTRRASTGWTRRRVIGGSPPRRVQPHNRHAAQVSDRCQARRRP